MTDEEREDMEALRYYVPGGKVVVRAPKGSIVVEPSAGSAVTEGIIVDVQLTADDPPAPGERSAGHTLPAHRPTRYALSLRRQAANRKRVAQGARALPLIRPGDCGRCDGWGVVGPERDRCPRCQGSGGT